MVLVFFFLIISIIIMLITIFLIFSTIRLELKNVQFSNLTQNNKKYIIKISSYLFNKIKWFSLKINNSRLKKMSKDLHLEQIDIKKIEKDFKISDLKEITNIKPKVSYLDLDIKIGIEDVILTSYIVPIICTILAVILPHIIGKDKEKYIKYDVLPMYHSKNEYDIKFNAILEIKIINILISAYKIFKSRKNTVREMKTNLA